MPVGISASLKSMKINLDSLKIAVNDIAQEKVQKGLQKAVLIVETSAKENCPKDNGILVNSIQSEVEGNVGYVYSTLPYAIYQELGTGIFAETNEGEAAGTGRQDPWHYFYTGKKLSAAEQEYIREHGYQEYMGKKGIWRTTRGLHATHFLYNRLNDNLDNIRECF